jgi:hypothetical protein
MDYLVPLLAFVFFLLIPAGRTLYVHGMKNGRYERTPLGSASVRFETDLGTIKVDAPAKVVEVNPRTRDGFTVPFAQITGIKFRSNAEAARVNESLRSFDLWDLLLAFHDTKQTFSINLVNSNFTELPLFWATQYEAREPLIRIRGLQLLVSMFDSRRADDFPAYCRSVYESVLASCRAAGLNLRVM